MKKKIFIIDDELEIVEMVKLMLETEGYETMEAYNCPQGLEMLENLEQNELPDIILLDIMMKPINGWETLRRIKSNEKLKKIPVSMLTLVPLTPETMGTEDIESIENYISKPFTREELLFKIEEILSGETKFKDKVKLIERKAGEKVANEYEKLYQRLSRHKLLMEALEKTAAIEGRKSYSMKMTLDNEEKMIAIWNRKMKDIEKKVDGEVSG